MSENTTTKENKMGVMPINKLLITMSIPMILSMLVQALYNIVDSMFVSKISENALTAVSLAFPAQNLMIAVATGTGVGVNALLSKSLGEKNIKKADKVANNSIFLTICSYAVFALLGIFVSHTFFAAQTTNEEIIQLGVSYLTICLTASFGIFGQITFDRLLQSTGKTFYTMLTQGTGAIINIVFDPILIFGLFGFPKMGVSGAAAATVIGQIFACILSLFFNLKKNTEIHLSFRGILPEKHIIAEIYSVGIPSIIMASISSIMTFGMNKILISFTTTATAVFGVYFKLQSFIFMPVFGLNNGMVPIVAYNYGARKPDRIIKTVKLSICYAVSLMLIGLFIFMVFPKQLLQIFNASDNMLAIGLPALRIISMSFLFAGYCIISSSMFQALGHGMLSMYVSILRQLVVLLPLAYLFSRLGKLNYVWIAFPGAEIASVIICTIFFRHIYRKEILPMKKAGN